MNKKTISIFIAAAVVVGAVLFYGGLKYGQNSGPKAAASQRAQVAGQFRGAGDGFGGRRDGGLSNGDFVNGEIINQDDKSLTVKLRDGGSKLVFFSSATQVMKTVAGAIADLTIGQAVVVSGDTNADGSITAKVVQLRVEPVKSE